MSNKITILLFSLFAGLSYGQSRKGQLHLTPDSKSHRLYVSFVPQAGVDAGTLISSLPELKQLTKEYHVTAKKAVDIPDAKLEEMKKLAFKNTGSSTSVDKLSNILELTMDDPSNDRIMALAQSLEKLDSVEYCSLMPLTPVKPPYDILPATPSFIDEQSYVSDFGVDMAYAWQIGLTGQDINIRDVEFGFNKDHEELNERNVFIGGDMVVSSLTEQDYTEHGTGVIGIMYADKEGEYGISGLAYGANELALFTEYEQTTGYNRVNAIVKCISNSTEGDMIVYELQATGAQGNYGPAEYENVVWDLTKAATDGGVMVVAAAGNGAENLDAFA